VPLDGLARHFLAIINANVARMVLMPVQH
jgi:hypothetical protein